MTKESSSAVNQKSASGRKPLHDQVPEEKLYEMIATNAYFRAEKRGFLPSGEEDDWLAAEKNIAELMRKNICE